MTSSGPFLLRLLYLAIIVALVPLLAWNSFVQQLNAAFYDVVLRLSGPAATGAVRDMALVAIDDRTAAKYGPLPLNRARLAEGIGKLLEFQPKVLVVDLLLSEATNSEQDEALVRVLRRFPRVLVGTALESDKSPEPKWIDPLPAFRACSVLGHVHAAPDPDGITRSVMLAMVGEGKRVWALGLQAARLAVAAEKPLEARDFIQVGAVRIPAKESDSRKMFIRYAGPEGTFRRVSFASLLEGTASPEELRSKIVFVGVTAQGSGDHLFTPWSSGIGMTGIEIHANITRTILDRAFLAPLGLPAECFAYLLIGAACILAVRVLRGARLLVLLGLGVAVLPVLCWLALQRGHVWPLGSFFTVFLLSAAAAGAGEYALVTAALSKAENQRKEYAFRLHSVAHEIKTPLTAIQGSSEMISEAAVPDRQKMEMAGLIYKESKRLTAIIQTFLDVERMAAGSLKLQKQSVDLKSLCAEVLERAQLYAARKSITIQSDLPPATLQADPDLLSFAIYNLLTNAVKYSPKGTLIRLGWTEDNGTMSISVSDQGYGIAPGEQQQIFDKFYRLRRDECGSEQGSGIGLALVKEIVVQHGGRILVESKPGAGSRFTMVLPKD